MTTVSIAMATYDGALHIGEQLRSLAEQSYLPAELVVTDDGSTDDTIAIIERFALSAPFPVRLHRNDARLGYRANFMRAAGLCQSELIAFCDQDDIWYPDKLDRCVRPFADADALMVYHNADVIHADGTKIGSLDVRSSAVAVYGPLSLSPWVVMRGFTQVVRRSLLPFSDLRSMSLDENNSTEYMAHDRWFYFLASAFGNIVHIPAPLAAYRQHDNNLFGWRENGDWRHTASSMLSNQAARYRRYAEVAESRARILQVCKARLDGEWRDRASDAADQYARISASLARRHVLYTTTRLTERLRTFAALLTGGDYGGHWGLGQKSLVKDACFGVLLGPSKLIRESS